MFNKAGSTHYTLHTFLFYTLYVHGYSLHLCVILNANREIEREREGGTPHGITHFKRFETQLSDTVKWEWLLLQWTIVVPAQVGGGAA